MTQAAKAQEPSMEEILASIRRIIADDDGAKPAAKPEAKEPPKPAPPPAPKPAPAPPAPSAAMGQDDIDAMLAGLDEPAAPEPAPPPPPPPPPPAPEPEPDVLELTEAMQAPPTFRKIDAQQDVVFEEAPEPPPPPRMEAPRAPPPQMQPQAAALGERIISNATAAAVDSAFNALAHTVLVQNAKTLEDLVKEMLRPMLQHWLDNNLPTLVERLVRAEIERVARGRG
jgi:cell pole-organizing protein PopZ